MTSQLGDLEKIDPFGDRSYNKEILVVQSRLRRGK
jgi:hypothetical protein